mgnify:CR=1 FL=1
MKIIKFIVLFFLLFSKPIYANKFLNNIINSCVNDGSIQLVGFRNISERINKQDKESKWAIGNEYEGGVFKLSKHRDINSNYSTIWFYSTIKNNYVRKSSLFWHVFVTPSEIQRNHNVRGYIKSAQMLKSLTNNLVTRKDYNYLIDAKTKDGNGFFLNNPESDPIVESEINKVWEKLISHRSMGAVYGEINKNKLPYMDYSLVLHRVDIEPISINTYRGGFLLPSSKKLIKSGIARGLVLDSDGNCLAHESIKVE